MRRGVGLSSVELQGEWKRGSRVPYSILGPFTSLALVLSFKAVDLLSLDVEKGMCRGVRLSNLKLQEF